MSFCEEILESSKHWTENEGQGRCNCIGGWQKCALRPCPGVSQPISTTRPHPGLSPYCLWVTPRVGQPPAHCHLQAPLCALVCEKRILMKKQGKSYFPYPQGQLENAQSTPTSLIRGKTQRPYNWATAFYKVKTDLEMWCNPRLRASEDHMDFQNSKEGALQYWLIWTGQAKILLSAEY